MGAFEGPCVTGNFSAQQINIHKLSGASRYSVGKVGHKKMHTHTPTQEPACVHIYAYTQCKLSHMHIPQSACKMKKDFSVPL